MPELYESEPFVYNQIPIRIFNHSFDGEAIFTVTHWHRNIEFDMVTKGRIRRIIDGKNYDQEKGGVVLVNSGILHADHWIEPTDHFEGITVQISKSFMDSWMGKEVRFRIPEEREPVDQLREFLLEFGKIKRAKDENPDPEQKDLLKYRTMTLLFRMMALLRSSYAVSGEEKKERSIKAVNSIKEIVNYIDQHYSEPLTLTQVADTFNYTSAHLSRLFKEHIGTGFHDYLQHVRLMNCVDEMKTKPDLQLTECALNHGFPNVKSFIQTFKRYLGCTPSAWMKNRASASEQIKK